MATNNQTAPFYVGLQIVKYFPGEGYKMLLGKRATNGVWSGPGGKAEIGETPLQAVKREAWEEANLHTFGEIEELFTNICFNGKPCHVYWTDLTGKLFEDPSSKNDPDKEFAEWKWFPLSEIPESSKKDSNRYLSILEMKKKFIPALQKSKEWDLLNKLEKSVIDMGDAVGNTELDTTDFAIEADSADAFTYWTDIIKEVMEEYTPGEAPKEFVLNPEENIVLYLVEVEPQVYSGYVKRNYNDSDNLPETIVKIERQMLPHLIQILRAHNLIESKKEDPEITQAEETDIENIPNPDLELEEKAIEESPKEETDITPQDKMWDLLSKLNQNGLNIQGDLNIFMKSKDKLSGGKADDKKPSDFNKEALEEGTLHELEHTKDRTMAQEIAMDHLAEDPDYYKKLKTIEKALADKLQNFRKAKPLPVGTIREYGGVKYKKEQSGWRPVSNPKKPTEDEEKPKVKPQGQMDSSKNKEEPGKEDYEVLPEDKGRPDNDMGPPPPENKKFVKPGKDVSIEDVKDFIGEFQKDYSDIENLGPELKNFGATHFASRLKDKNSLFGKMQGRLKDRSLNTVTDVIGARSLAGSIEDQQKISQQIQEKFDIVELDDSTEKGRKDGYRAIHILFRTEDGKIGEMQIKTHLQQVYSGFTHDNIYKGKPEIKNSPEVLEYTRKLSDYLYNLDQGKEDVKSERPQEPEILKKEGITFPWKDLDKYGSYKVATKNK